MREAAGCVRADGATDHGGTSLASGPAERPAGKRSAAVIGYAVVRTLSR
jgi:hypothetical protein